MPSSVSAGLALTEPTHTGCWGQVVLLPSFYTRGNGGSRSEDTWLYIENLIPFPFEICAYICYLLEITIKNKNGASGSHCLNANTNIDKKFRRSYHFHQL